MADLPPADSSEQEILPEEITDPAARQLIGEAYRGHVWGLFLRRITAEHITQLNQEEARENERVHQRFVVKVGAAILVLLMVMVFIGYLIERLGPKDPELLKSLIQTIVAFASGIGLGAGGATAYWKQKRGEEE